MEGGQGKERGAWGVEGDGVIWAVGKGQENMELVNLTIINIERVNWKNIQISHINTGGNKTDRVS